MPKQNLSPKITDANIESNQNDSQNEYKSTEGQNQISAAAKCKKQNAPVTAALNSSISNDNIGQITIIPESSIQATPIAIPVSPAHDSLSRAVAIDITLHVAWIEDPSSVPTFASTASRQTNTSISEMANVAGAVCQFVITPGSSIQATAAPIAIPVSSAREVTSRPLAIGVPHHVAWTEASAFPTDYFPSAGVASKLSTDVSSLNTDINIQR